MFPSIISKFKWILYPYFYKLRRKRHIKRKDGEWILGRVACLGQDVFKLIECQIPIYNTQKGRVDYLTNIHNNSLSRAKTSQVVSFIKRKDIISLIAQQEIFEWQTFRKPKLIYMDSFSELTDQLFINREEKWSFCANYSDVVHTGKFKNSFEVSGLLSNENIEKNYRNYFRILRENFPDTPILFLHFPVKLDNREVFKVRYRYIRDAIDKMEKEFSNFHSISVDEKIIDWPEEKVEGLEKFPYHFNKITYQTIAHKVKAMGLV